MKIEMGESLILSWLKPIKKCQIVQTNWKVSKTWETFKTKEVNDFYHLAKEKFGEDIFKKNSQSQLIQQAEIDAVGVAYLKDNTSTIYAVDIAYHESGLNYGSAKETVNKITKKITRPYI